MSRINERRSGLYRLLPGMALVALCACSDVPTASPSSAGTGGPGDGASARQSRTVNAEGLWRLVQGEPARGGEGCLDYLTLELTQSDRFDRLNLEPLDGEDCPGPNEPFRNAVAEGSYARAWTTRSDDGEEVAMLTVKLQLEGGALERVFEGELRGVQMAGEDRFGPWNAEMIEAGPRR